MKWLKCFVIMSTVLVFSWVAHADNIFYQASGTTDYSVTFKTMAQGFAVLASSNPVTIIASAHSVAVDTFVVEAGNSMFFYCPADHLAIDRTLATAVTINPTFNNAIVPNLGISTVNLQDAVEGPTPVAVSPAISIFSGLELIAGASTATVFNKTHRTYPITGGIPVDGVKAVLIQLDWTKWVHGGLAIEPIFSASAIDTGAACYSPLGMVSGQAGVATWRDTISMDDSLPAGFVAGTDFVVTNGTATLRLNIPPGAGYLYLRLFPHSYAGIHIHGFNGTARKVE